MAVGNIAEREDRPAIVRFKRVAVEDKAASLAAGRYVARDVDYALITPPYSKDIYEVKVDQWLRNLDLDVQNERIPAAWRDMYIKSHEAWKNGQEMPLNGTAIRGWPVISPAQQEMLIRLNILTVEDLAAANDEGLRRIGMGGSELRTKARAWAAQAADKGPLTQQNAALTQMNERLAAQLEAALGRIAALEARIPDSPADAAPATESITADDILPESEPPRVQRKK